MTCMNIGWEPGSGLPADPGDDQAEHRVVIDGVLGSVGTAVGHAYEPGLYRTLSRNLSDLHRLMRATFVAAPRPNRERQPSRLEYVLPYRHTDSVCA
jgi:hypothetical protein